MMYFFPIKVKEQKHRIEHKKLELDLYRKIINDSLGYMKQKIQENKHKQELVNQVNNGIGEEIKEMLEQETEYYISNDKDKLKVPPYVNVKRIQRPGFEKPQVMIPIVKGRNKSGKSSRSGSKSVSRSPTRQGTKP